MNETAVISANNLPHVMAGYWKEAMENQLRL